MAGDRTLSVRITGDASSARAALGQVGQGAGEAETGLAGLANKIKGTFSGLGSMIAGAGIGTALAGAFSLGMDITSAQGKLQAQLGLTATQAGDAGKLAGSLYANNFGADMGEVESALANVSQQMGGFGKVSQEELKKVSEAALTVSATFGTDVNESIGAASKLVKSGMAPDMASAFDMITSGMQRSGIASEDVLETIGEYTPYLSSLGVNGNQAFGMMSKAVELGVMNTDKWADAMKEFGIRAIDGSATTIDAYTKLGFNAQETGAKIAAGGPQAATAMSQIVQALQAVKDPVEQNRLGVELFGTQWEDTARTALASFDPLANTMDNVAGSTQRAGDAIAATPTEKIEAMKRGMQGFLADLTQAPGILGTFGTALSSFGPEAISMAGSLGMVGMAVAPMLSSLWAASAGVRTFALTIVTETARAAAASLANAARTVASWVMTAAASVVNAAIIAAAWLAANPIALIIAAIVLIVALIIGNWDKIKAFLIACWEGIKAAASAVWSAIVSFFTNTINNIVNFFVNGWNMLKSAINSANAAIASTISSAWNNIVSFFTNAWNRIKSAVTAGIQGVLGFVRALPGQILSAIGNLGNLLFNAGKSIIDGLWNGIKSMGSFLKNSIMGFIKSFVPGPVLSFLGIASPSKLFAEMGQWIPAGLAKGIEGNASVASDASGAMASDVARAATGIEPRGSMIPRGSANSGLTVVVNVAGSVKTENELMASIEQAILRKNRNNSRLAAA